MLAVNAAALVALLTAPALAQPPGSPPTGVAQPGLLPYPPGYRPRTLPPQAQPQRSASPVAPEGGSGGRVMYFQKPADALAATGGPEGAADGVAQLTTPGREPTPFSAPDVSPPALPPPSPTSRPAFLPPATAASSAYLPPQEKDPPVGPDGTPQPPTTSQKKEIPPPPGGAEVTQLPPRAEVFRAIDDAQLEKMIVEGAIRDLLALNAKKDPKERKSRDELIKSQDPKSLQFPPLPVISPPGVPYQVKTYAYEPRKMIVEPFYVVHRRLYFEERNGERTGWDLGPLSTLVATTHFYIDTLLVPQTFASGHVYGFWDTSAGKCLPGSPTPYYLYPPGLTLTGSAFEAGVITGFAFLFP